MFKFLFALLALGAAAFSPAGSAIAQSRVVAAAAAPLAAEPAVARASSVAMSAVTERDADGNPVTHMDMFDPVATVVQLTPFLFLLLKFGGVL